MQLYVIRIRLGDGPYISVMYCFLQSKFQIVYREMWRIVQDELQARNLQVNVAYLLVDFEQAVINSFAAIFGQNVELNGCFFHLCQSTWRKIQSLGLMQIYKDNINNFQEFAGMLDAIAFLPRNDVSLGITYLRNNMHPDPRAVDLVDYFDNTYVNGPVNNQRLRNANRPVQRNPPMFPPNLWNVHDATIQGDPRTNNVCESWNNSFKHIVGHNHPSMWACLQGLQKNYADDDKLVRQDAIGQRPRVRVKPALVAMQERLQNLCNDYNLGLKNIADFLRGVAHNIRFTV